MRANNESLLEKLLTHCSEAPPAGVRGLSSEGVNKASINGNITEVHKLTGVFNQVNWFEVKDLILELHCSAFYDNDWVGLCQI